MAITQYGQTVKFGTKEVSGFIVQNGTCKEAWDVKTWVGPEGVECAGVKYKHRYEVTLSVIGGETAPDEAVVAEYFGKTDAGTVIINDKTETHTPEDAVQYDITATIYPDMK